MKQPRFVTLVILVSALVCFYFPTSGLCDPIAVTIWQKEARFQVRDGDTISLYRQPFRLVFSLAEEEWLGLIAASGKRPKNLEGFGPARGMAGPYDGLFLTWQAFHYFDEDASDGAARTSLWSSKGDLRTWTCQKIYDNTGDEAQDISWRDVPVLKLIFRKENHPDLNLKIRWKD